MYDILATSQDKPNKKLKPEDDAKEELQEEACEEIAAFFYVNAISLNASRSEKFDSLFEKVARHGVGYKPPL
ncbi:hypothetical protein Lal_00015792 [Lupinus albus]|nr:hypothetical protein Lal_00015792 [Lupinus albus]